MRKRMLQFAGVLALIILTGYVAGAVLSTAPAPSPADLMTCLQMSDLEARTKCLDAHIQRLLTVYSGAEIMDYISASTTPTKILYNCHPVGHIVGNLVYKKYGSIDKAIAQCNSDCRSACTHGIIGAGVAEGMGEAFPDENIAHATETQLKAIGARYCDKGLQLCHAVGHVAYIATSEPSSALAICDAVGKGASLESCYEGVFMERAGSFYSVLSPGDSTSTPPIRKGDYAFPCNETDAKHKQACYLFAPYYQQPLFAADGIMSLQDRHAKEISVCESLPLPDRTLCFEGMGATSYFFGTKGLDIPQMEAFCDQLSTAADRQGCTKGVTLQYLYFDHASGFAYCEGIEEASRQSYCFTTSFRKREASDSFSGDYDRMCGSDAVCTAQYKVYLTSSSSPAAK